MEHGKSTVGRLGRRLVVGFMFIANTFRVTFREISLLFDGVRIFEAYIRV